jgi:hypothetical protein
MAVWITIMATIQLDPDNIDASLWWMKWVERDEIIGRIIRHRNGCCQIAPSGPHWSPMKSFGTLFDSPETALVEVELYFRGR